MKKIPLLVLFCMLIALSAVTAEDGIDLSIDFNNHFTDSVIYYNEINPVFRFLLPNVTVVGDFSFINDGKYQANKANTASGDILGYYIFMNNGYLAFDYSDFAFTIGQKQHSDYINSDYSLFISGNENPAFIADFTYDGDLLFFETRWIRLNERSANTFSDADETPWPDRGANFKTYALKLGDFKLGFQDSVVYIDRAFDLEYFINPLPQYFIQYVKVGPGRPWKVESNDNSIMGAFLDYTADDMYFYAQYLMDDFNLYWLFPDTPNNPNKMAYTAGGRIDTDFGKFTFDAALAFKYTFQASYAKRTGSGVVPWSDFPYEYTYYPSSTFIVDESAGTEGQINYVDNYLGYKYGENNLAIQAEYENTFNITPEIPFKYRAGIEYIVSGSKSPSNPWFELDWHTYEGTKFLDEAVLEHTVKTSAECGASWNGFSASLGFTFGYVFNELTLTEVVPGEAPFFVPGPGLNRWLFDISLGIGYRVTF